MAKPVLISNPHPPSYQRVLRDLWRYREVTVLLVKRAMRLRYKNSVLGLFWSLAPPLMFVFTITVMRKVFLRQEVPNYSAYLMPVMFAWMFFSNAITEACGAMLDMAPMIRRVYFPREVVVICVVAPNLIHLLLALGMSLFYLVAMAIFPWQVSWQVLLVLLVIPAQAFIVTGISLSVACLNVLYEDVRYIVVLLMQVMMYAVPILYPIENVAHAARARPWLLEAYLANPFAALLVLYQKAMLPPAQGTPVPALPWSWALLAQTWVIALVVLAVGATLFHRTSWRVVERL